MNQPTSLQAGTRIDDYEIRETLWTTNSGFIYLARDPDRDRDVLIQEYLPPALATRHWSGIHAMPLEGLADDFDQGLTRFLREARILAQINDPYVCRVYEYTEANATAYMVLDYEPGGTLHDYLAEHREPLDEGEIRKMMVPLLKGLRVSHAAELLHRDINPANIYLRDVGPPVLIGFGSPVAAPQGGGDPHVESRVAPGYSPVEQYQSEGEIGPWSDLYALGATMYRCLSGAAPVDAARRVTAIAQDREDPLVPATELGVSDYSSGLLSAIDWMMEPMAADRPQDAGAVLGPLTREQAPRRPAPADRSATTDAPRPDEDAKPHAAPAPGPSGPRAGPYRDHSKREPAIKRAPRPADGSEAPRPAATVYRATDSRKRARTGYGWPLLVVLAGVSLVALFLFYEPSPPRDVAVNDLLQEGDIQAPASTAAETPPPDLPEKVNFGRAGDDQRADEYRVLQQQTTQIERMLAAAKENMSEGRLVSPAGDNALASYRAILALDPDQTDARLGLGTIQTELVKSAEKTFSEDGDVEAARRLLARAADVREESERAKALRAEIQAHLAEQARQERLAREAERRREEARQRAEQERREEIAELVTRAQSAFDAGRLTQPAGDNALAFYRRVLRLEPEHQEATQGVQRIGRTFLDRASDAIAKDELDRAEGLLSTAAAILPDDESVSLLRKQLQTRREVAERERRERQRQAALAAQQARQAQQSVQARQQAASTAAAADETDAGPPRDLEDGVTAYYAGDYDIAYRLLQPLAEADQPRAKFRLAMMYYHGRGLEQDINLAENLIREALPAIREQVARGAAWAQADLASLYADGIVVAENDKEAVRLYRLAAEQGYAGAQTNLGVMYANGEGVFRNREDAIRWLQRAAEQGDRIAQKNLQALGVQ